LIFSESYFLLFTLVPAINNKIKNDPEYYGWGYIDFFDILFIADTIAFYVNLFWLFILILKGLYSEN